MTPELPKEPRAVIESHLPVVIGLSGAAF